MSSTSRIVWLMRCSWPAGKGWPGSVTSMRSWASESESAARLSSASRSSTSSSSSLRIRLPPLPTSGRSSAGRRGDGAQELGERALAPQHLHARLLERGQVGRLAAMVSRPVW